MWIILLLVALAVLGPLFGTDTRDGLDWKPGHFWRRPTHRYDDIPPVGGKHVSVHDASAHGGVRSSGSHEREDAVPGAAAPRRPVRAAW
ncbi:hypothetical protein Acsp03_13640 [Actinomadura sp. NBRC 104412]|nr:hypothetical protein Acsp03_13640 [Actinomadura sp. NBRC 104412]